jgi:hypothetical protein
VARQEEAGRLAEEIEPSQHDECLGRGREGPLKEIVMVHGFMRTRFCAWMLAAALAAGVLTRSSTALAQSNPPPPPVLTEAFNSTIGVGDPVINYFQIWRSPVDEQASLYYVDLLNQLNRYDGMVHTIVKTFAATVGPLASFDPDGPGPEPDSLWVFGYASGGCGNPITPSTLLRWNAESGDTTLFDVPGEYECVILCPEKGCTDFRPPPHRSIQSP